MWDESATREELKTQTANGAEQQNGKCSFLMFRKWSFLLSRPISIVIKAASDEALKLHIFWRALCLPFAFHRFLCPPPENAPCALHSKFKSLCIGPESRSSRIAIAFDWYRGMWNACYDRTWFALLFADIAGQTAVEKAHQAEYFHYVLQNITHSVFAAAANSQNVVKCRFRPGCEFWHRRKYFHNPPSTIVDRHAAECSVGRTLCYVFLFLLLVVKHFFISITTRIAASVCARRGNKFERNIFTFCSLLPAAWFDNKIFPFVAAYSVVFLANVGYILW